MNSFLLAQMPEFATPSETPTAESCFAQTARRLQASTYLGVDLQGEVTIFNQRREIHGSYQEMRSENHLANGLPVNSLRYEIAFTNPSDNSQDVPILMVLDGKNQRLWLNANYFQLDISEPQDPTATFRREYYVDLNVIADCYASEPERYAKFAPPWYGQRSLENVLRELQETFTFGPVRVNPETNCWEMEGRLKPEVMKKVREARNLKSGFPEEIPQFVRVSIHQDSQLLDQIQYGDADAKSFLTIRFKDYRITDRFDPEPFLHIIGATNETNVTEAFLSTIK